MTDDWTKKLKEEFSSYDFFGCYEGDVNYVFPSGLEKLEAFIAEQRQKARESGFKDGWASGRANLILEEARPSAPTKE